MNEKLKQARIVKGLSQIDLAKRIGVSRQTINMIENGAYNPTIELCIKICKELDVTLNDLFGRIARIYKTKSVFNKEPFKYKFMGLNPNYTYKVRMYNSSYQFIATGDLLNNFGIDLESFFFRDRRGIYDTQLSTLVVLIDKI